VSFRTHPFGELGKLLLLVSDFDWRYRFMKKIVWISPYIPYDTVRHAGGQIHNYYIKKLVQSGKFEVRLVSSYLPEEIESFTLNKSIRCDLICNYDKGLKKIIRNGLDVGRLFFPFDRYGNQKTLYNEILMTRILRGYKKEGFIPDILIVEWTQSLLSLDCFRRIFPNAKIIGIEEDVTIQALTRKWERAIGIQKVLAKIRLQNIKREEIRILKECDIIIVNNVKDEELLKQYGFDKNVKRWVPFYHRYDDIHNVYDNKIIYYGDMRRRENYTAAEWFIREVMPALADKDVVFQVIGSNPPEELKGMESDNVQVTGYIADIKPFFETALCMIAPLSLGAGIKIKVLEGMSAGLPVLTNEIGIEGIPAVDERDFMFCKTNEDYVSSIIKLLNGDVDPIEVAMSAKALLDESFNFEKSANQFIKWVEDLR